MIEKAHFLSASLIAAPEFLFKGTTVYTHRYVRVYSKTVRWKAIKVGFQMPGLIWLHIVYEQCILHCDIDGSAILPILRLT